MVKVKVGHFNASERSVKAAFFIKVPLLWIFECNVFSVCNTALSEWKHPAKF